jgi:hypothetical protein
MSLVANRSRLAAITKDLSLRWQETREQWSDSKSDEFNRQYMLELFAQVDKTVTVIEKLDELLSKARKECE